jgi:hypothetical protein
MNCNKSNCTKNSIFLTSNWVRKEPTERACNFKEKKRLQG